ncbi:unnamed protein product [Alopecurus aequalis]
MGSWFSSPDYLSTSDFAAQLERMKRRAAIPLPRTPEEFNAYFTCMLANDALQHYNSTHQGAEFQYLDGPAADTKSSCVGFRRDLWYHLGFSATRKDGDDNVPHRFFAELRFDPCADNTTVQTCTILEKPLCRFRRSCAFCPEDSNILHPGDDDFRCGKEGQQNDFFRERCAWDGDEKEIFSQNDMLSIPFSLGGGVPRYRLVDQQ